jgi:hypothetical protein
MLELARLCSERSSLDCNLLFAAFGLGERGLVGIKHFMNDALVVSHVQPEGEWEEIVSTLDNRGLVVESQRSGGPCDSQRFTKGCLEPPPPRMRHPLSTLRAMSMALWSPKSMSWSAA